MSEESAVLCPLLEPCGRVCRNYCGFGLIEHRLVRCHSHRAPSEELVDGLSVCSTTGKYFSGGLVPPAACCSCHVMTVGGCLIHAARWRGAFSSRGGSILAHAASFAGWWQRG